MEIQLVIVLIIAFIVLGPERMMDLAYKLGEAMRKVREVWDEIRMQAYMEEINRKVMEQEKELEGKTEDETLEDEPDEPLPDIETEDYNELYHEEEEDKEDGHGEQPTPDDAPDRTPKRTQNKAD